MSTSYGSKDDDANAAKAHSSGFLDLIPSHQSG
jgi:hypothetical protein